MVVKCQLRHVNYYCYKTVGMSDIKMKRKYYLLFFAGGLAAIIFLFLANKTIDYTSTNEFCAVCHAHPHAETSFMLSTHNSNSSGFSARCVDCHLPPEDQTVYFLTRKAYHGFHDLYYYLTRDMDEIDWEAKRSYEASKRFVYEDGCKKCHTNLFPATLDALGAEAHLKYLRDPVNNSCVKCHLTVGHYRGEVALAMVEVAVSPDELYDYPANVTAFENFTEMIPGTNVSFNMMAVSGGTFNMGSPQGEPYRRPDEGPVREVQINDFFMAEVEVTWNEYLAFFNATSSQGRRESELADVDESVDGISGATPPWGAPDQGWGMGNRPAITMTHHAAMTYCRWLSSVTGKNYRLPTEAEWEYAARAGTTGPYFFEGSPRDYETDGLWNRIFGPDTSVINSYVVYQENSPYRTQPPSFVKANPFGLKNMLETWLNSVWIITIPRFMPNTRRELSIIHVVLVTGLSMLSGGFF
jgi:formylglycine-generating enzyme